MLMFSYHDFFGLFGSDPKPFTFDYVADQATTQQEVGASFFLHAYQS
jgi:hypothetical protein